MSKYICNPINFSYRYQFIKNHLKGSVSLAREAADPSLVEFKGKYYLFPSMTKGFLVSEDLTKWTLKALKNMPVYDYAPDVRVVGEYLYFCASKHDQVCDFYRTKDPMSGEFEKIDGTFPFWDPNLFVDEDDRVYFYWGCSNTNPIYGVELDPKTMVPLTSPKELLFMDTKSIGYERGGVDHMSTPGSSKTGQMILDNFAKQMGVSVENLPPVDKLIENLPKETRDIVHGMLSGNPFYEGAWMTKHKGVYYLQYATPGAEFNVYNDAYYVSDNPMGPFTLGKNNPFSYFPGGFIPGAGHGSTLKDLNDKYWHTSTMRISQSQHFERRIGLWKTGFDQDGELFCDQRYGDWPFEVNNDKEDIFKNPKWMLLSYGATAKASSNQKDVSNVTDEDIRTLWKAETHKSGEWVEIDLGKVSDVHAVQVNFSDDMGEVEMPVHIPDFLDDSRDLRYIDDYIGVTQWKLEKSIDGIHYNMVSDKWDATTDLPHDLIVDEKGFKARYIRLTINEVPYQVNPCISGLRLFGLSNEDKPEQTKHVKVELKSDLDMDVSWEGNAVGYNILWGHEEHKLYHSYLVYGKNNQHIGALVKGSNIYVRVDAFNGAGITKGEVKKIR